MSNGLDRSACRMKQFGNHCSVELIMTSGLPTAGHAGTQPGLCARFRRHLKRYFWLWIAWQTVKGITTTTIIWAPLAYMYLSQ